MGTSTETIETITFNEWHHLSATRQNGSVELFINGGMKTQGTNASTGNNNLSLCIGASNTSINTFLYHFKGLIDDVRIYDRALSAEEVQALYNLGQ